MHSDTHPVAFEKFPKLYIEFYELFACKSARIERIMERSFPSLYPHISFPKLLKEFQLNLVLVGVN
jgi:hypothetical protein